MKILVFGHRLEVGGTQVNAIELSTYLRDACGHQIVYFAIPGPMTHLVEQAGLRYVPAPDAPSPSLARMQALDEAIRIERPDVIHVWDWPQWLDAFVGVHLFRRVPVVVTCMSMVVPSILPKLPYMTFGTPDLVEQARASGRRFVRLMMPPVDLAQNSACALEGAAFRKSHAIAEDDVLLVTVSRLVDMKAEGIRRTMDAVRALGSDHRLRLAIVGDGTSRADLEQCAGYVNSTLGRKAVILAGAMLDPRPAYAAADVVVGMGGSALRGMAFAKPVVVVGELGFSALLRPETEEFFFHYGIYGQGSGNLHNNRLAIEIAQLVASEQDRLRLGEFARSFVECNYSIDTVGRALNDVLITAAASPTAFRHALYDTIRTASLYWGRGLLPNRVVDGLRYVGEQLVGRPLVGRKPTA